jgi:hypothetical protein
MKNHDRRIPIPGFTEYGTGDHVGHPSPNMIEVSVFVCMNVCMYIYICMYTYIYMNTCIYMNVYIDTYMYKYIYIYMYIYMYTALQQLINRVIINAMTESFEPYFLFSNNIILQGFLFKSAQSWFQLILNHCKVLGMKIGVVTTGNSLDHTEMDDKLMLENGKS